MIIFADHMSNFFTSVIYLFLLVSIPSTWIGHSFSVLSCITVVTMCQQSQLLVLVLLLFAVSSFTLNTIMLTTCIETDANTASIKKLMYIRTLFLMQ